ncbi:PepSY domain-containing protein [Streptomyces sp. NPDC048606]|uniref:PepSY domain-containing protein n=1 Tax=Streptomyces sp. NPDC048606 TaxID=3154726 RepID=UPI0034238BD7
MKRNLYVCAAASVALVATGPAVAAAAGAEAARAPSAATAAAFAVPTAVDAQGAVQAALKSFPGKVESLDKDGTTWHVDVISADGKSHAEVELDANGGVVRREVDTGENPNDSKRLKEAATDAAAAMKAALAAHKGEVVSVDFDEDDNGAGSHWNVEVRGSDGKTWNVDAKTGKVTTSDADDDSDDDSDQDDDGN